MDTAKNQIQPAGSCQITNVKFLDNDWISGRAGSLHFHAKVCTEASRPSINTGSVSRLIAWPEHGPIAVNYDCSWDVKPKNAEEERTVKSIIDFCSHVHDGAKDSV